MNNLLAQVDYTPLVKIPQLIAAGGKVTPKSFLEGVIPLIIGVAGGLAVIMIVVGGIKYMTTDAFMGKKDAKDTIRNAFLGLLLAISSYVLLNTINPKLLNLQLAFPSLPQGGRIASSTEITTRTASQTGCTNDCAALNPNNIPIKTPGACDNNPCYLQEDLVEDLEDLADELEDDGVGWQVVAAYPSRSLNTSNAGCWGPGNLAGSCVFIAPTVTRASIIDKLMKGVIAELSSSKYTYGYNACGARLNALRNDSDISAEVKPYIQCISNTGPEGVRINKKSV